MQYSEKWYAKRKEPSHRSAEIVVSLLKEQLGDIDSIVDFGCGTGEWLAAFKSMGATKIYGVDGPWVDKNQLVISPSEFIECDLSEEAFPKFLDIDLAISLEVAEHVPRGRSEAFVDALTATSSIVYFGAAVPGQGGTGHINEQWQTYWKEKFEKRSFVCVDSIRPLIWEDANVAHWYRQNAFLYVRRDCLANFNDLKKYIRSGGDMVDVIHPELFRMKTDYARISSRDLLSLLKKRAFRRR